MLFWLLAGLLTLIALAFVLPPLWRQRPVLAADMDGRNIAIAKNRLAELNDQLQSGALEPSQYDAQRTELEQALSDDLDIPGQNSVQQTQGRRSVYVLAVAVPLLAITLYVGLGTYQAIEPSPERLAATTAAPKLEDINKMVGKLAEHMKTNPTDAQGWIMLGKSYKYLQHYPKAVDAFAKAYQLLGDRPDIMLLYADALAFVNDEQLAGKPAELVFKALALEPDNVTGLWLGGMAKAQAGDALAGIKLWRKLVALLPPESPAQQEVQGLLAKLESQIAGGVAVGQPAQTVKAADIAITVQVSLAPDLQKSASPNDTVFIYAQALSGPRMPLAIIRKQVSDLPLTVSLTDAMAMMPTMKLSGFSHVKLLARISKTGKAMSQAGDLIGIVEQVTVTDKNTHSIVINSQVKNDHE
ncbi:MAG: c-type cytochrome biogenesis protein CcmI [Methylovulum sp.]|nr:c-type cytochrome biogenesis protein CcmI [Methylovulum sp.]